MKKIDAVLIAGPQGSGKGTQGKLLANKLGFLLWDMGVILREMSRENTPLAKKLSVINQGTLLTDEVIIEVAKERLALTPSDRGIVFDGLPRRLGQAEFLVAFLRAQGRKNIVTIFIDLPREESIQRLLLRAKKEGRVDDTPEAIETRFRYYDEAMKPTIDYLRRETRFIQVDGRPSVAEIAKHINAALGI